MRIDFDFHGVRVRVRSRTYASLLEDLRLDFGYFLSATGPAKIEFVLVRSESISRVKARAPYLFRTRMCRVYGFSNPRICDYGDGLKVFSRTQNQGRRFIVSGDDAAQVYEAVYIAILSSVGEELDRCGYHRVHALAFSKNSQAALLPLPPGGGKSSTALLMLRDPSYRIFSDEIPLLHRGRLYPFPTRIGILPEISEALSVDHAQARRFKRKIFKAKILVSIPNANVAAIVPVDFVLSKSRSFFGKIKFAWSILWGLGTPQMAEYMLRGEALLGLFWIALSRLREAWIVLRKSETIAFITPKDPYEIKDKLDRLF
jgi:hypothetical protein